MDTIMRRTVKAMELAAKAKITVMLVGAPGTGKTASVRALAERINYELITVIGSQMEPTDVLGMPKGQDVDIDGDMVPVSVFLTPEWQERILRRKRVILFLDEYSNTSPATRAALLCVLQNREFPNGRAMPAETIIIGAMNPAEQAADGYDLDLPTTNRIFFIPWSQSIDGWCEGMLTNWGKPCSDNELMWKARVAGFIKENPTWLHREPKDVEITEAFGVNQNDASEMEVFRNAWASGRSWDNLTKTLGYEEADDTSLQDFIGQGLVGYAAMQEFREWLIQNNSIRPADLLRDPKSIDWNKVNVGEANSVLRGILTMMNAENLTKVLAVFDKIADDGCDYLGAPFISELSRRCMSSQMGNPKKNTELLTPVMKKYLEVSRDSL